MARARARGVGLCRCCGEALAGVYWPASGARRRRSKLRQRRRAPGRLGLYRRLPNQRPRPVGPLSARRRGKAETMAAYGIPEADIARVLGVSKPTLRKHCGTELDTGATRANSKVADFLFYGICGGTGKPAFKDKRARFTAAICWMKTRAGWSETSTHKHTGVANGAPIEVEVGTVRERLMRRIARIAAAGTTGGVPETDE